MRLSSPVFDDGDPVPERYGYEFENVSPPLTVGDVPAGAASLALVVDDPDAAEAAGEAWDHWLLWNVDPAVSEIREGRTPEGAVEGENDFGETGYGGPRPPDGEHTYRFRLFALDADLHLDAGSTKAELEAAMADRVLDEAILRGTFAPR